MYPRAEDGDRLPGVAHGIAGGAVGAAGGVLVLAVLARAMMYP
jgi:hypothetical protein